MLARGIGRTSPRIIQLHAVNDVSICVYACGARGCGIIVFGAAAAAAAAAVAADVDQRAGVSVGARRFRRRLRNGIGERARTRARAGAGGGTRDARRPPPIILCVCTLPVQRHSFACSLASRPPTPSNGSPP